MDDINEKLNTLLSDPDSMARIMQLAQQLSGGSGGQQTAAPPPPSQGAPERGFFNDLLGKLHLSDLDAGDLLLLFLRFYLSQQKADEELLIAIGLLLIL